MIDSHCHLEPGDFRDAGGMDERPAVLARAAAAGVRGLVVIGAGRGLDEVRNAVALARAHAHIHAVIAVHPHDACGLVDGEGAFTAGGEEIFAEIAGLCRDEARVVGVGETGLDYHYKHSTPVQQRAAMRRFLALAQEVGKPVSLHIRDAHEEARGLVAEAQARGPLSGVVHCFTGGPEDARAWVGMGFCLSFSGIVTFKSAAAIQEACRGVPADRLLLETDCPYLAPVPLRGKRNEPAYLVHTAAFVAGLRGLPATELAAQAAGNTRRLFNLPAA